MEIGGTKRTVVIIAVFVGVWLGLRYLFPVFLPFLLGWGVAALAEPGVKFLQKKLHFRRSGATALSVPVTLVLLLGLVGLAVSVCCREAAELAKALPGAVEQLGHQVSGVRAWAVELAHKAPAGLSDILEKAVSDLFTGGSVLIARGAEVLLGLAGRVVEGLPRSALLVGTAVVSAFLISAQMPDLKARLAANPAWSKRWQPTLARLRTVAGSWIKAQLKLSGVTLCIVLAGYWVLGVENAVVMAVLTALVDAIPMLGTGTILIPWCIFAFLSGEAVRAVGLLGVYVAAMVTRSGLEPKLVGRQLGMNPLVTLMALYAGFQIWGVPGMILAPILIVTARELARGD